MLLALFPLQLVLFPGEEIPLHIFEERYKQLITECRDDKITFGMPTFTQGGITTYGTEAELVKVLKTYPGGEMDIVVRGRRIFKITKFMEDVPDKLYSGGIVEWVEDRSEADETTKKKLIYTFKKLLASFDSESPIKDFDQTHLSFAIGPYLGLSINHKIDLITTETENERQNKLIFFMEERLKEKPAPRSKDAVEARFESVKKQYYSPN